MLKTKYSQKQEYDEKNPKEHLLAVPFDKDNGICLMKSQAYKNKLMGILKLKQLIIGKIS